MFYTISFNNQLSSELTQLIVQYCTNLNKKQTNKQKKGVQEKKLKTWI